MQDGDLPEASMPLSTYRVVITFDEKEWGVHNIDPIIIPDTLTAYELNGFTDGAAIFTKF